ncbi:hypothetical protein BST39_11260 [Mycobacterium paraseoulense]|uniref:Uncharacterized protein n=1 Tax=Mycobacterium paraseoulense TaxID=590652 RepID=A0A1X0ICC6_9MYCO|nr:hypothetical protein BST39_11260 [Mycobacterium paraseoulense]
MRTAYIKVQVVTPAVVVQPQPDIIKALEAIIRAARILLTRDMALNSDGSCGTELFARGP